MLHSASSFTVEARSELLALVACAFARQQAPAVLYLAAEGQLAAAGGLTAVHPVDFVCFQHAHLPRDK